MYKYENLVSFEVKATLAEHYACAENIHKEDAEGEHYQGGEGALSEVSCPSSSLAQPIVASL